MAEIKERLKKNGKKTYTVCIRIKGYRPMYKTFDRLTDAKAWAGEYEPQMKRGKVIKEYEASKHTLAELIDRYLKTELPKRKEHDQKKYKMQLEWWKNNLGFILLSKLTPAVLSECKEKLATEESPKPKNGRKTRTGATVNRYMACLSTVLSKASKEWGWIDENPMLKVSKFKEVAKFDRILTEDEIQRLMKACKEFEIKGEAYHQEAYLFVFIALVTGARYSEIHKLKWSNVDLKNKQFYFLQTKNGESRGVPISDEIFNELVEFQKVRNINSDYLFTTKSGRKLIDMRVRFQKAIELAKIENCRFHDLRHTVASYIAMDGGSVLDIAAITGHKSMQMVKRYSHLTKKHNEKIVNNSTAKMFSKVKNN